MFGDTPEVMVYVYELPKRMSNGYCFDGGVPVVFSNVDWFNSNSNDRQQLQDFISKKRYIKPGLKYLVCSPEGGDAHNFVFEGR